MNQSVPGDPLDRGGVAPPPDGQGTLDVDLEPTGGVGRRRVDWRVAGGVAVIAVVLLVGAFWRVPYFTVAPGSLRATEPLISVEGAPSYPDDAGEIGYLTVTFGQTTPFGLVRAWIDGDIEVLSEDQALGGLDRDENREVNEALMTNAKDTATAVALDALGYDVELLGTGSIVIQVEDGTPAVGVVQPGDVIVSVDGEPVTTAVELTDLLATAVPGQEVLLGVQPQSASMMVGHAGAQPPATTEPEREVPVTLAERPDEPGRAYLGVRSATRDATYNLPFDVTIDSGNVIGPSAGLAFTLAVIDVLTPGNLTGGSTVAVTGTISPSGQVGRVGGVPQKAAAAMGAGATVYLVPVDEAEQARTRAGDAMEVVPVATLDEALAYLATISGDTSVVDMVAANRAAGG